jgi:tetratricopeptide (TPR) repeat protein
MDQLCAITGCNQMLFKHGLCRSHYSVIAREALTEAKATGFGQQVPVLRSALYVFNRMTDSLLDGYRRAFKLEPKDMLRIYLDEAENYLESGATRKAQEALEQALKLSPGDENIIARLGELHLREGRFETALECWREVEAAQSDYPEIHHKLGQTYAGLKRFQEAAGEYERAIAAAPDRPEIPYSLGVTLEALGKYDDALLAFQRAAELKAGDPRYQQALGFTYEALGQHKEALSCFKKALELER